MADRPVKITFAKMRNSGVRGILVYSSDYKCSHSVAITADAWPDDVRLSDNEPRSDVRPDLNWKEKPVAMMGYR
jgi:hypothetical protein